MTPTLKKILKYGGIAVGVVVIIIVIGSLGKGSSDAPSSGGLVSTTTGGNPVAATSAGSAPESQTISLLKNLSTLRLQGAVFSNPTFRALSDISIVLPQVTNQGRRNPFAPLGSDGGSSTPVAPVITGGIPTT